MAFHLLYISYDGLTDALGQSQILAYQKNIASPDCKVTIVSFEKRAAYQKLGKETANTCQKAGIDWHPLFYTKNPPVLSTAYDLFIAWKKMKAIEKRKHIDIVHCRGYVSALLGEQAKKRFGSRFIFDMRGWWPDEKLESGFWSGKMYQPVYRYFKRKEAHFFQHSDITVSLTEIGKTEIIKTGLKSEEEVRVVSTCTDLSLFKANSISESEQIKASLNFPNEAKILVYSGALGGNYPINDILLCLNAYLSIASNHYCLILSKDKLSESFTLPERTAVRSVSYAEVGKYLAACDVGFIYYKKAYSNIGRCPTKLGEYWACGLPALSPSEVGDVDRIFEYYPGTGITVLEWEKEYLEKAMRQILASRAEAPNLQLAATDYFSLEKGVSFYKNLYKQLLTSQTR